MGFALSGPGASIGPADARSVFLVVTSGNLNQGLVEIQQRASATYLVTVGPGDRQFTA